MLNRRSVILILLLVDLSVLAVDAAFTAQVLVSWAETGRGGGDTVPPSPPRPAWNRATQANRRIHCEGPKPGSAWPRRGSNKRRLECSVALNETASSCRFTKPLFGNTSYESLRESAEPGQPPVEQPGSPRINP
jgi:hypothetical protein